MRVVTVILVDGAGDFRFAGEQRFDHQFRMNQRAQLVEGDDVVGIGNRDLEPLLGLRIAEAPAAGGAWPTRAAPCAGRPHR